MTNSNFDWKPLALIAALAAIALPLIGSAARAALHGAE